MNRSINDIENIHCISFKVKERDLLGYKMFYLSCDSSDPNDDYNDLENEFFINLEKHFDLNIAFECLYEKYKSGYVNIRHFQSKYHHLYSLCNDNKFIKSLSSIFRNKKIDDILN